MGLGFIDKIDKDISIFNNLLKLNICGDYWICHEDTEEYIGPDGSTSYYYIYSVEHKESDLQKLLKEKIQLFETLKTNINQFNKDTLVDPFNPDRGDLDYQFINSAGKTSSILKYYNKDTQEFEVKPDGYYVRTNLFDMESKTIYGNYISNLDDNINQIVNLLTQHNNLLAEYNFSGKDWDDYPATFSIPHKEYYQEKNKVETYLTENNRIGSIIESINTYTNPFVIMNNRFYQLQIYIKAFRSLYNSYQSVLINIHDFINNYSEISCSQDKSMAETNSELDKASYFSTYSSSGLSQSYNYVKRGLVLRDNSKYKDQDSDNQYLTDISVSLCLCDLPPIPYQIEYYTKEGGEQYWYWKDYNSKATSLNYFDACSYILSFILEVRNAYSI